MAGAPRWQGMFRKRGNSWPFLMLVLVGLAWLLIGDQWISPGGMAIPFLWAGAVVWLMGEPKIRKRYP
jgi:hypothetical protein